MRYILSVFIPPLGILLTGKIFSAIGILIAWVVICIFIWPMHVVFVIVAWVIIAQARADKRHRETLRAMNRRE